MNSMEQGNFAEAEELCYSALREAEASDVQGRRMASSLQAMAALACHRGRYLRAQHLYNRAWGVLKVACGKSAPETAAAQANLGWTCLLQNKYDEADAMFSGALPVLELSRPLPLGPLIRCLHGLGDVHLIAGRRVAAVVSYQRAIALQEKAEGAGALSLIVSLHKLADLYLREARYADAEPFLWRAHKIATDGQGAESPAVAVALRKLAEMYRLQKHFDQAETLLAGALPMIESALGAADAEVARHLRQMSLVYKDQARYVDAAELLARAVGILQNALDAAHPEVAETLDLRAETLEPCHQPDEARALRKRAADIREKLAQDDGEASGTMPPERLPSHLHPLRQTS